MRSAVGILLALVLSMGATIAQACESGHWIEEISGDGSVVLLEDGSVWLVDEINSVYSAIWLVTDDVIACAGKLINTDQGEVVQARRVR